MRQADQALAKKDFEEAVMLFTEIIKANPTNAHAYHGRALAYENWMVPGKGKGHEEQSLADFNEAIRLKPDGPDYVRGRAFLFSRLMRHDEAIRDYTEAIRLDPADPSLHNE